MRAFICPETRALVANQWPQYRIRASRRRENRWTGRPVPYLAGEAPAAKKLPEPPKTESCRARSIGRQRDVRCVSWEESGDRQPLGTDRCHIGGNRSLLFGLALRGLPDRLARIDD
jgi:hypothetical protein